MPADKSAPDAAGASTPRSRTVAAGPRASRTSAPVGVASDASAAKPVRKKAPAKGARTKPSIAPSPGTGEGTVLTAVASEDSAVAVVDAGPEGLTLDETVVAGPDGAEAPETPEAAAERIDH